MAQPALMIPKITAYPPSFMGDPFTFGWALFSLTAVSAFCIAMLGQMWREASIYGLQMNAPYGVARAALGCLLTTILMGAAGDVAFLYAWGEVSPNTLRTILATDRWLDTMLAVPFFGFSAFILRGRQVITFQLIKEPIPTDLWPTWPMVRQAMGMLALIFCLAAGVTVAK